MSCNHVVLKRLSMFFCLFLGPTVAASPTQEDESVIEEVVVTASMSVTAGGAQDLGYVRQELIEGRIPHPQGIHAEGLLSEYDLSLTTDRQCAQRFCLFHESTSAALRMKPEDTLFVGLGFATNIEADTWQRKPVNLIAVVDKSGSMDGRPLQRVRTALAAMLDQMTAADQLSIVLYGDQAHVYLPPTRTTRAARAALKTQIAAIESAGSTYMEDGLKVGITLAEQTQTSFAGTTRLMLFTDERPNVGDTSAEGFTGMTIAASKRGIGMTTLGVGVQFDATLARAISSTRGGNLFFLDSEETAKTLFGKELDTMVSELAYDLVFRLKVHRDYQITGVYGVPNDALRWHAEDTVEFDIPTVFLSRRGGGVFVGLAPASRLADLPAPAHPETVLDVAMAYTTSEGQVEQDKLRVAGPTAEPSRNLALAGLLVDQYLGLKSATTAHHVRNDQKQAYETIKQVHSRLTDPGSRWLRRTLREEAETTGQLLNSLALLSGHRSEVPLTVSEDLLGMWKVERVFGTNDMDIHSGDVWVFGPSSVLYGSAEDVEDFHWNWAEDCIYSKRYFSLVQDDLLVNYRFSRDKLHLDIGEMDTKLRLRKVADLKDVEEEFGGP